MKKLSFLNKIVFFLNNLMALFFLAALLLPYVSPRAFPLLSILSLVVPLVLFAHFLFLIYWIVFGFKKQLLLSLLCILLSIGMSIFPYKFNGRHVVSGSSFSLMNFNVRLFNIYEWIESDDIPENISRFIAEESPDIISFQEYYPDENVQLNYPYKFEKLDGSTLRHGLAIFSKFKIVNQGSLDFEKSHNNAIFADILRNGDTIRIYNVHLESLGVSPDNVDLNLDEQKSKKLIFRLKKSFIKQQDQVELFLDHKRNCHYKVIVSGDFNNTSFSWAYLKLKGELNDSFTEAGKGFGKTYSFNKYPLRIDFILADKKFKINEHQNFNIKLSDHEPVAAEFSY